MNNTEQEHFQKFNDFVSLFITNDENATKNRLIEIYASLIPLIVSVNLLLIFGIIKTKRNKFTSSQILFLALFMSDLTFGVVQLPIQIYLLQKSSVPTCFEFQLNAFTIAFPIFMSGTTLLVISADRYIKVIHCNFHKKSITNKSLTIIIIVLICISFILATLDTYFRINLGIKTLANLCIAMSAYAGASLATGVAFNIALLKKVKQKTKNSSITQVLDSSLTKTISIIMGIKVAAYLPFIIALNIAAYAFYNETDKHFILEAIRDLFLTLLPIQINAVLNSIVFFTRNSRIRRYYYKLFNHRKLKSTVSP